MKGLILKIENGNAYIMKNDGTFMNIKAASGWQAGQIITVRKQRNVNKIMKYALSAASFAILIIGGLYFWNLPVAYVDVSVNPNVEFTINRLGHIVSVEGFNEDGKELVGDLKAKGIAVSDAYLNLLESLKDKGYLSKADAQINLEVSHNNLTSGNALEQLLSELTSGFLSEKQLHCGYHAKTIPLAEYKENHHGNHSDQDGDHHQHNNDDSGSDENSTNISIETPEPTAAYDAPQETDTSEQAETTKIPQINTTPYCDTCKTSHVKGRHTASNGHHKKDSDAH